MLFAKLCQQANDKAANKINCQNPEGEIQAPDGFLHIPADQIAQNRAYKSADTDKENICQTFILYKKLQTMVYRLPSKFPHNPLNQILFRKQHTRQIVHIEVFHFRNFMAFLESSARNFTQIYQTNIMIFL